MISAPQLTRRIRENPTASCRRMDRPWDEMAGMRGKDTPDAGPAQQAFNDRHETGNLYRESGFPRFFSAGARHRAERYAVKYRPPAFSDRSSRGREFSETLRGLPGFP